MLNKIWFWLLCIGIVYGFCKSAYQSLDARSDAVEVPAAAASSSDAKAAAKPATDAAKLDSKEPGLTAMGKRLNGAVLEAAKSAVDICLPLFGIMALQHNFIDRDALLAAFHSWVVDKSQSLGALLVGAIFAKIISTANNWLFSPATNLVNDIYIRYIAPQASNKKILAISRLMVVLLGIYKLK